MPCWIISVCITSTWVSVLFRYRWRLPISSILCAPFFIFVLRQSTPKPGIRSIELVFTNGTFIWNCPFPVSSWSCKNDFFTQKRTQSKKRWIYSRTEFWSIELSIFFAAYLGAQSLSAQVCAYQTAWLLYMVTSSFATAANIRIGQFLGAGKPLQAANAKNVTYAVGILVILMNMSLLISTHYWFPFAYNTEAGALPLARRVLLLVALLQIWDGYNVINTGIVKAW